MLSIIIPTYNEQHNVLAIADRVRQVLDRESEEFELIFVDDSTDRTPLFLEQLHREDPRIRYFHRKGVRGLATAVMTGFTAARGSIITVMDADLQHPAELLPTLLERIRSGADLVIPSRFIPGGCDGGLDPVRKVISRAARALAWLLLKRSRCTTDPMSGFFMTRRQVVFGRALNPVGWKILLEVLMKGDYDQVAEVPYRFQSRHGDSSKMNIFEQFNYLRHLVRLALASPEDCRLLKFALVGLSGLGVNLVVYTFFVQALGLGVVLAGICSAFLAMLSNFFLNDRYTWKNENAQPLMARLLKFYIYCSIGILINTFVLLILYEYLDVNYLLANLMAIATATVWNFGSNNRWTWGSAGDELVPDEQ